MVVFKFLISYDIDSFIQLIMYACLITIPAPIRSAFLSDIYVIMKTIVEMELMKKDVVLLTLLCLLLPFGCGYSRI